MQVQSKSRQVGGPDSLSGVDGESSKYTGEAKPVALVGDREEERIAIVDPSLVEEHWHSESDQTVEVSSTAGLSRHESCG